MAPTKTVRSKHAPSKGDQRQGHTRKFNARTSKSTKTRVSKLPPPKQQKTKPSLPINKKNNRKTYTDEELGVPKLNTVTPTGITAPRGKKKGKIFVDDAVSRISYPLVLDQSLMARLKSKV